jgi:hemerythrin-like domain-containing protein
MTFTNRISQMLHDEHGVTVALMERLEQLLSRGRRGGPPDMANSSVARLLSDLSTGVEAEIERHFSFEEDHLFRYLEAIGDADIGVHLTSEHAAMRPLGVRVAALARAAAVAKGFKPEEWEEFVRVAQELGDRMLSHVQKEEMALLPVIEENMDPETEGRLYQEYAENV